MPEFPDELPSIDRLERMTPEELNELPFGVLELTADGTVVRVNRAETGRVGRDPADFIGRNFFTDIAPCTNVREFAGDFRLGVRNGDLAKIFEFVYQLDGRTESVFVYLASAYPGFGWVLATVE